MIIIKFIVFCCCLLVLNKDSNSQASIEQKLILIENSKTLLGNFKIEAQIKGSNLPIANTLGSTTIDIIYDSTKLRFVNGSDWHTGITSANGYSRSIQSNNSETGNIRAVRIGILGFNVNGNGGGTPPGYDITTNYETIVRMNFIILNTTLPVSLTIKNATNQIGLFENHNNEPNTGIIMDQNLSNPINLVNIALPVLLNEDIINDSISLNNFPNPFNNSTIIKYYIPNNSFTQILLFNNTGKLLETLIGTYLTRGHYTLRLNLSHYSSGIYYLQLKHNGAIKSKKILIIK